MNFYGKDLKVWKANLHTHTTVSDGFFTPEQVAFTYERGGYDVLFLTDHRRTNDVTCFADRKIRVYSGIELHPTGPRGIPWHILGLGVPRDFDGQPATGQAAVDAVNTAGGVAFVAHPYWCGFTSAEVMSLRGTAGIEVYNTSTRYIGKDYNMQLWDEMLDAGATPTALAVDDVHNFHDFFRGWTMICAEENTYESILGALKSGSFYASQGPRFEKLSLEGRKFEAEFTEAVSAVLLTNRSMGFCGTVPGEPFPSDATTTTHLAADLSKLPSGSYIRCQIRDAAGRYAWSNPVRID